MAGIRNISKACYSIQIEFAGKYYGYFDLILRTPAITTASPRGRVGVLKVAKESAECTVQGRDGIIGIASSGPGGR